MIVLFPPLFFPYLPVNDVPINTNPSWSSQVVLWSLSRMAPKTYGWSQNSNKVSAPAPGSDSGSKTGVPYLYFFNHEIVIWIKLFIAMSMILTKFICFLKKKKFYSQLLAVVYAWAGRVGTFMKTAAGSETNIFGSTSPILSVAYTSNKLVSVQMLVFLHEGYQYLIGDDFLINIFLCTCIITAQVFSISYCMSTSIWGSSDFLCWPCFMLLTIGKDALDYFRKGIFLYFVAFLSFFDFCVK